MASGRGHQVMKSMSTDLILFLINLLVFITNFLMLLNVWNTGEPWQFTDWGPGKPENDGTALNILWDFYSGCMWKWNDDHTDKETPFICENKIATGMTESN